MTKSANVLAMTPFDGAKTQLYAAASPEVDELDLKYVLTAELFETTLSDTFWSNRAAYLVPIATVSNTSQYAQDPVLAQQLWDLSNRLLKGETQ